MTPQPPGDGEGREPERAGGPRHDHGQRSPRGEFIRRFHRFRLYANLVLLTLIAFVPTAALLLHTTVEQHRRAAADAEQEALRLARVVAREHERAIEAARQILTMLTQLPDVRQQRPDRCAALLADLLRRHPRYANLGAVTLNGSVLCSAVPVTESLDFAGGARFWRAVEKGDLEIGEYQIDRATGRTTLNVSYPLVDDTGAVGGAVFAAVDLAWLKQIPAVARLPEGATLTISDRLGRILIRYPDPAKWVGHPAWERSLVNQMLADGEGAAETTGLDGVERLVGFTPLRSAGGGESTFLTVAVPHEAALAAADRVLARNLAVLGLVAALALAAAVFVGNRFVPRHVRALTEGARLPAVSEPAERARQPHDPSEQDQSPRRLQEIAGGIDEHRPHAGDRSPQPVRFWLHGSLASAARAADASIHGISSLSGAVWSALPKLSGHSLGLRRRVGSSAALPRPEASPQPPDPGCRCAACRARARGRRA